MTYEQLQMNGLPKTESKGAKSPSYRQDFRVSRTALQEKVSGIVTAVTCGEKLQECSERLNHLGSSVKIHPVYLQGKISNTSEEYSMTLPRWGIASGGEFGELVMSERRTEESGCSSSQTGIFPTPLASDAIRMRYKEESLQKVGMRRTNGEYKKAGCNLSEYVAVFPTPQATSWGCPGARKKLKELEKNEVITATERKGMQAGNGGKLNPTWVEALMGFPTDWTNLED